MGEDQSCPKDADVLCTSNQVPNPPGINLIHPATADTQQAGSKTVEPVDVAKASLDVSTLMPLANYIFDHETVEKIVVKGNKQTVTTTTIMVVYVRYVNGVNFPDDPDDLDNPNVPVGLKGAKKFELRTVGNGANVKGMLCPIGSSNDNECSTSITGTKSSIEYNKDSNLWTVNGSIAPGLIIFKGNLFLESGTFINTIGATGSIEMKGDKVYSLSWAGDNGKRNKGAAEYAPKGVCTNTVTNSDLHPTNLCDMAESDEERYDPNKNEEHGNIGDYGNYGLLATVNINLQSNTSVFGAVKAGSMLTADSNTTAHGYVSGLGGDVQHTLKGFTIDLTNLPDGYKLVENETEQDSEVVNTEANAVILWSRYKSLEPL